MTSSVTIRAVSIASHTIILGNAIFVSNNVIVILSYIIVPIETMMTFVKPFLEQDAI